MVLWQPKKVATSPAESVGQVAEYARFGEVAATG